jgi:hypothetical protein
VRLGDGTRVNTPFVPIGDGAHSLEMHWIRASAPDASDGVFRLYVDNATVATLPDLDNDAGALESARLGALTVKAGASGTLFYDQFESRREFFIGPE